MLWGWRDGLPWTCFLERDARKVRKMTIVPGKTYLTRDGRRVRIERETSHPDRGTYIMRGTDERGRVTWRSRRGRFDRYPSQLDLVAKAPRKNPVKRKVRRTVRRKPSLLKKASALGRRSMTIRKGANTIRILPKPAGGLVKAIVKTGKKTVSAFFSTVEAAIDWGLSQIKMSNPEKQRVIRAIRNGAPSPNPGRKRTR